jgi:YggT family protein
MLLDIVRVLLNVFSLVILVQAVLSWLILFNVINTYNEFIRSLWQGLQALTEPVYRPIRRLLPDFGALDLSPLVALLILSILTNIVLPRLADSLANSVAYG